MKNEEILKKAIEKAMENGWEKPNDYDFDYMVNRAEYFKSEAWWQYIFSHSFAKAFWGKQQENCEDCNNLPDVCYSHSQFPISPGWKIHLQQMVLEEDPIKYLEKFL